MSIAVLLLLGAAPAGAQSYRGYIPTGASKSVTVIDPTTNAIVARIPLRDDPNDIAVSPDGTRLYVIHAATDTVSAIDTATNAEVAMIPVGNSPAGMAFSPDGGRLYVSNAGNLSVIDTATNAVVTTFFVGTLPGSIAITPDGEKAYVSNTGYFDSRHGLLFSNDVSVVDLASNSVVAVIPGYGGARLRISPDGTRLYLVTDKVTVVETATNAVVTTIEVGSFPSDLAISPDGARAIVANAGDGTLSVIDTATNTVGATVAVGGTPRSVAITPDGGRAYVTDDTANVSVIDTGTNLIVDTLTVGNALGRVAFGPVPPPPAPSAATEPPASTPTLDTAETAEIPAITPAARSEKLPSTGSGTGTLAWGLLLLVIGGALAWSRHALGGVDVAEARALSTQETAEQGPKIGCRESGARSGPRQGRGLEPPPC